MRHRTPPSYLVVRSSLAALLALTGAARADHSNQARVTINPNFSGGGGPVDLIVTQPGLAEADASSTGGFESSGTGHASVNYGDVFLSGRANGSLNASASGITRDSITITAPGIPTGTQGTLTFSVRVEGNWSALAGSSVARWHLSADIGGGFTDISKSASQYSGELGGAYVGDPTGTYSATVTFQYGFPTPLHLEVGASAQAAYGNTGPGAATFNMPHALTWLGISLITAGGQPVNNAAVSSESGTDWSHALGCPADFNADGFLDFFDIDSFIEAFESGDPSADFNNDGFIDFFDADAFVEAFESGC